MASISEKTSPQSLPLKSDLKPVYTFSLIIAFLITAASLGGLLFPSVLYPSEELRQAFLANDVVNFIVGLPILLGSMWLAKREKLIGLLCWPGALLYTLYNYIAYIFGLPFSWMTLAFILLVLISAYAIYILLKGIEWNSVKSELTGRVPEKLSGGFLIFYGVAFFFLAMGVITGASAEQAGSTMTEVGVAISDITLSVLLCIGGVLLFLRKSLGYASGMGLLFATIALFIGVILIVLLQPVLTDTPFVLDDVVALSGMAVICLIPTGLFARGIQQAYTGA